MDRMTDAYSRRVSRARIAGSCIFMLITACELQPIPFPDPAELLSGPCTIDEECDEDLGEVCFDQPDGPRACLIPCLYAEDCPEGFTRCGELVGERDGRRVCVNPA